MKILQVFTALQAYFYIFLSDFINFFYQSNNTVDKRVKDLEETRKNLAKELLSMTPDQNRSASGSSSLEKAKKSKEEVEAEEREKMQ